MTGVQTCALPISDRLQRLALSADRISGLLVTHFHSDHIAEIGALNFLRWTRGNGRSPLQVWGPEGVDEVVQGFNQAYTLDLGYRRAHHTDAIMPPEGARAEAHAISFAEEETIKVFYDQDGLRITAFLVDHPPIVPAVGYRFDFAGRSVAISGDTVRSQNLVTASRGVDLLIHEAIANNVITLVKPLLEQAGDVRGATILVDALENHTFPPDVFALAQEAGARSLAISHRSEEHTSELQSRTNLVCRLLLEKKNYFKFIFVFSNITTTSVLLK